MNMRNESGFSLISSMIFLVILTVIGIAATNTSTIEIMISQSEKSREKAFFAAEAGIAHGTAVLMNRMADSYKNTSVTDWDFALSDSEPGVERIDSIPDANNIAESFIWIKDKPIGNGCTYTVMTRDNDDDSDLFNDTDNIIFVTARATLTNSSVAGIEVSISGTLTGGSATGYTGQAGAGSGKSYRSDDAKSIKDFSPQARIGL